MSRILLVYGPSGGLESILERLRGNGDTAFVARGLLGAREALLAATFDAVLTTKDLPDGSGWDVARIATAIDSSLAVVLISSAAAVPANYDGEVEVVSEECDREQIWSAVRNAGKRTLASRENLLLKASLPLGQWDAWDADSAPIPALRGRIAQVAGSKAPVLITGEAGAGKHVVAHSICAASSHPPTALPRWKGRRLAELLQWGADPHDSALMRAAGSGPLLLDGAEDISSHSEVNLPQLFRTGMLPRRGSSEMLAVHARILVIARATRPDDANSVVCRVASLEGVELVRLHVPALRERLDDLPALGDHISRQIAFELRVPPRPFSAAALSKLHDYEFPGNVRELRNLIQRAYMVSNAPELQPGDFILGGFPPKNHGQPLPIVGPDAENSFDLLGYLQRLEEELIRRALDASGGAQAEAARRMGISRSLLSYKLNKYGIRPVEGAHGTVRGPTSS